MEIARVHGPGGLDIWEKCFSLVFVLIVNEFLSEVCLNFLVAGMNGNALFRSWLLEGRGFGSVFAGQYYGLY